MAARYFLGALPVCTSHVRHGNHFFFFIKVHVFSSYSGTANPRELPFPQLCQFLKLKDTTRVWDSYAQGPYAYNGKRWYSFDDFQSVTVKAKYCKENGFGGVMVWCLHNDYDPNDLCDSHVKFPIHSLLTDLLS